MATIDHRSDVFSLGSCLYEMLTRIPPFTATNEMDLLIKVRDAKYRPIVEIVQNIPPEIEGIADRCLQRSRAHRFQTAQDAGDTLRTFLKGFMPGYSRSHLGRYVRKLFSAEIERELRMLEEYVLSEEVDDDVGENLIGDVLGPGAEFVGFSPRPTGDTTKFPRSETTRRTEHEKPKKLEPEAAPIDVDTNLQTGVQMPPSQSRAPTNRVGGAVVEEERTVQGLNVHDAKTLILDLDRPAVQKQARSESADDRLPPDYDPNVHNEPTLILDTRRRRKQ